MLCANYNLQSERTFETPCIILSWRSVWAFTYDPLHIQIGPEYFIELVKYKFQGGWFIQFKIQYQLRIKSPKAKCIKTLMGTGPLHMLANHCRTLVLHLSGVSRVIRVQAGAKDLFISFGICPMNQFVYSDCCVFIFIFSKCTVCYVLVFVSFNLLVL